MSLFPAYGDAGANQELKPDVLLDPKSGNVDAGNENENWQQNRSYALQTSTALPIDTDSDSEFNSDNRSDSSFEAKQSANAAPSSNSKKRILEFDSTVEFYVDKASNKAHREWDTLPRLSRPQYKIRLRRLLDAQWPAKRKAKAKRMHKFHVPSDVEQKLSEEQSMAIMQRIGELNVLVANEPQHLHNWIELHELLGRNLSKTNRLAVAEHQLHTLETALQHHAGNEKLLQLYVATASATYPDSQVATKIEQLLEREPFEYTLWSALIMTTQGTMARCNVPDVLQIYEQSMRRMHLGHKEQLVESDDLMLRLFHNCVLFLRQSSNHGHMFALLKLALELNAQHLNFDCFEARAEAERPLVDYEELVLRSGMPMPEIWSRIERLRQAYHFLPYPQRGSLGTEEDASSAGLDPQRCVYSSDVCHYIYPLKSKMNQLQLLLLVVQLTKLPFVRTSCLAERLSVRIEQIGDSEAIEMLLASLGERLSYALPLDSAKDYQLALLQLSKELYVSPSFLPHAIGHELYEQCLSSLLLKCSEVFIDSGTEHMRRVFLLLWFRFERLRMQLLQLNGRLSDQLVQAARQRHRQLLRLDANRCVTRFFTELAMFEYEVSKNNSKTAAFRILDNVINELPMDSSNVELLHAVLVYAEMLIGQVQHAQALHLLNCLTLQLKPLSSAADIRQDQALLQSRLLFDAALKTAESATPAKLALPLEDYFMPNELLLLLRLHCLMLYLLGQNLAALELLQQLLDKPLFALELTRTRFLREQLRELQVLLLQLPQPQRTGQQQKQLIGMLEQSLLEFPRNLCLLQRWSTLTTLPWYKLRGRLVHTKAGILALLHLVIAARCRFNQQSALYSQEEEPHQLEHLEQVVRNRVLSMFETFLPNNPHRSKVEAEQYAVLRRNSLYWRCYLRCLSHQRTSFERSKSCLLMALDECPWDKALYMDGVIYVPQEVGNLQDVMTEKQLRIYALPEELMVLRDA